jgi:hypothetical protein
MMEAICSSETSALTRATQRKISEDANSSDFVLRFNERLLQAEVCTYSDICLACHGLGEISLEERVTRTFSFQFPELLSGFNRETGKETPMTGSGC